jgi:hypothetical protein
MSATDNRAAVEASGLLSQQQQQQCQPGLHVPAAQKSHHQQSTLLHHWHLEQLLQQWDGLQPLLLPAALLKVHQVLAQQRLKQPLLRCWHLVELLQQRDGLQPLLLPAAFQRVRQVQPQVVVQQASGMPLLIR